MAPSSEIDEVLDLLKDGRWHESKEIMQKTGLHEFKAELIVNFLVKYNFVEFDKNHEKMRLTSPLVHFFREIKSLEGEADTFG